MPTASLPIPEHVYLSTTYEPDCDFVDGVLEERNWGDGPHAQLQPLIGSFLFQHDASGRSASSQDGVHTLAHAATASRT